MTHSRDELVIDVVLDWRLAAAMVVVIGLGVALVSATVAQAPPTANGPVAPVEARNPGNDEGTERGLRPQAAHGFVTLRSFYLTDANYDSDEATGVCADGYHMASLWEVLDVSNLAYAYDHPDAHTKDDSGSGPPSHWYGWIRTGWASGGAGTAGVGNCENWTSTDSGDDGSIARLTYEWTASDTVVGPWEAATFGCGGTAPVWCVED